MIVFAIIIIWAIVGIATSEGRPIAHLDKQSLRTELKYGGPIWLLIVVIVILMED